MLVSFTQTYGSGRDELLDIYSRDHKLLELKRLFDHNIYSFHNCDQSTIDKFMEINPVPNTIILRFDDEEYTNTVRKFIQYIKDIGCTHFFWSQDDSFSAAENKDVDWKELIDYVKTFDRDFMLSLFHKNTILDFEGDVDELNTINVYRSTTLDFYESHKTPWPFDDSPYICTVDMLDEIYDEEYLSYGNIWDAEEFLREKYSSKGINRFVTNKKMFQNYNLYGKTTYMEQVFRKILMVNGLV